MSAADSRLYPEAERLRQVLGAFYKTVDVMKSARNQNKAVAIWPDDMKAVEDVMVFLEQLRDQNSDGGVEKHGDFSQTRSESPGAQDRIAGVAPGPSDPAVQANWLANYATCFVDDERVGRRLIEIAEILRSGVLAQAAENPVAWILPGEDTASDSGWLDARVDEWGEFTRPLYGAPQPPAQGWQDIGTAPRDGSTIDLWCLNISHGSTDSVRVPDAFWDDEVSKWEDRHGWILESKWRPTHWRAPPDGPAVLSAAGVWFSSLIESLRPFAYYFDLNDCEGRSDGDALEIPVSDLRAARDLLKKLGIDTSLPPWAPSLPSTSQNTPSAGESTFDGRMLHERYDGNGRPKYPDGGK